MLTNEEMARILYEASNLLEEKQWCKGELGRAGSDQFILDRQDSRLYGDNVTHLCMEGAVHVASGKFAIPEAREVMGEYLRSRGGTCMFEFNDSAKSKDEVLREMREFAVELLEKAMVAA